MTDEPTARATAGWLERFTAEVARGRHVIVHGNVRDLVRWNRSFQPVRTAVVELLGNFGYQLTGFYDLVDGLSFATGDDEREFHRLAAASGTAPASAPGAEQASGPGGSGGVNWSAGASWSDGSAGTSASGSAAAGGNSASERSAGARGRMAEALRTAEPPTYRTPHDALAAIRRVLRQALTSTAFVVDLADLLLPAPEQADPTGKQLLGTVAKAMIEAAQTGAIRNLLVLVADDLATLPPWLYRDRPYVQVVEATRPSFEERYVYLGLQRDRFHAASVAQDVHADLRILANLSEGMATTELDGLWRMSRLQRIPLDAPRDLMKRTLFGPRQDPWRRVAARIHQAKRSLNERVLGQATAVERVSRALGAATVGIDFVADPHSGEARPKGVFFFVGPTGVGKTELARAISAFVFDDETALARFDMSTFAEAHAAERLTGAPPGYVGHERGGELTNRVSSRPFSLLLFDEIEKAHPAIFDKFLQVLDDGRLTDALGRTAYFSETIVIFTSNIGAAESYNWPQGQRLPDYDAVAAHFEKEVRDHFTRKLGRPELLGRMGNGITVFDILRPEVVGEIARKLLGQLVASAARRNVELTIDEPSVLTEVRRRMAEPDALKLGARAVRNVLDRLVREPVIDWVLEHPAPAQIRLAVNTRGETVLTPD